MDQNGVAPEGPLGLGESSLQRMGQEWVFDWLVSETGRVYHFTDDGRGPLPRSVKSHAMISKHLGRQAVRMERIAREEESVGHQMTALEYYFSAATTFAGAQHVVFSVNDEKRFLHGRAIECYDAVRRLSPNRIDHLTIETPIGLVHANLHLCASQEPLPCVFYIPGCDMTKEMYPHPLMNHSLLRGFHLLSFDGPGMGESNVAGTHLTVANFEQSVSATLDVLSARPEIDADQWLLYGQGFGSYWGMRVLAVEPRFRAAVLTGASWVDLGYLMDWDSPRYKRLFRHLMRAPSEAVLDTWIRDMDPRSLFDRVGTPTLLMAGEYDPRAPLEVLESAFRHLEGTAELWIFADRRHLFSVRQGHGPEWNGDVHLLATDWLKDRLAGSEWKPGSTRVLEQGGSGPYGVEPRSLRWFDE